MSCNLAIKPPHVTHEILRRIEPTPSLILWFTVSQSLILSEVLVKSFLQSFSGYSILSISYSHKLSNTLTIISSILHSLWSILNQ
ncbi:hypothetical protein Bca101_043783 [Brassica carinata]